MLGGSALFAYLGCQAPDPATAPAVTAPADTLARIDSSARVSPRPDPGPQTAIQVRNGPRVGDACAQAAACTMDGVELACDTTGTYLDITSGVNEITCVKGDTIPRFTHMGFAGLGKAGPRAEPRRIRRHESLRSRAIG